MLFPNRVVLNIYLQYVEYTALHKFNFQLFGQADLPADLRKILLHLSVCVKFKVKFF